MVTKRLTRMADDTGIALVVVIGAVALVSVFAAGGYALARQAMHSTGRLQTEEMAFQVASAGMDRNLAAFKADEFSGGNTIEVSDSTPDGHYIVTIAQDPQVSFKYSMISRGTVKDQTAVVRQDFYFFNLWNMNVASQNNPDMGPIGSAASWNGNSTIAGPFYIGGDADFNSNIEFVGGPLFVSGHTELRGGVNFTEVPAGSKYLLFAGNGCSGAPSNVKVYNSSPTIELPWVDPTYMDRMLEVAKEESSDNLRGSLDPNATSDDRVMTNEVSTMGAPSSYTGTRAPGATTEYKVIPSDFTLSAASASFGKVTKVAGVATEWDDFAYDAATRTLYVEGVVFVDGDVTIGNGVLNYQGKGMLVSTGDITVDTGGTFQPVGGDANPDDLTPNMCLALVADQNITLDGCTFEGIVFANGDLNIAMNGALHGAVHAHAINSLAPHTYLYMETGMGPALLPVGTPGSPSDPREDARFTGQVIRGTWSRIQ